MENPLAFISGHDGGCYEVGVMIDRLEQMHLWYLGRFRIRKPMVKLVSDASRRKISNSSMSVEIKSVLQKQRISCTRGSHVAY